VEEHEPSTQQFTDSLQYIDQVAGGAASLGNILRRGLALDAKLGNQFSDRLTTLLKQVDADADVALAQMGSIYETVKTAMLQAGAIESYLTTYASSFLQLDRDAASVSEAALPGLSKGVQLCNTLASILDPLSGIIEDFDCQSKNPVMVAVGVKLTTFKSEVKSLVNQQHAEITKAFDFIISEVVPSAKISSDIDAINTFVSLQGGVLDDAASGLSSSFDYLKSSMAPTKTFDYQRSVSYMVNPPISIDVDGEATGGGREVTRHVNQKVSNFFVDADFKQTVIQLVTDMNNAAMKEDVTTQ
jgi:hypothetical protein